MDELLVIIGRIRIRGDDGKPTGELGEPEEFIAYKGMFYPVSQLLSAPGVLPHQLQIQIPTNGEDMCVACKVGRHDHCVRQVSASGISCRCVACWGNGGATARYVDQDPYMATMRREIGVVVKDTKELLSDTN